MKCLYCQGRMERSTALFHVDRKGYHFTWDALPAWVCTQCGEVYFEATEIETIQGVIRLIERKTRKLLQRRELVTA